ncbi:hypothetical protein RA210_U140096 [Rubrivivax sp. A210]|nr:hypothetical protein RA210_U140096 [Rubrivivax sp. A210]
MKRVLRRSAIASHGPAQASTRASCHGKRLLVGSLGAGQPLHRSAPGTGGPGGAQQRSPVGDVRQSEVRRERPGRQEASAPMGRLPLWTAAQVVGRGPVPTVTP